jgi:glycosyltransferase involved in cell wall biosynthesis
MVAPDNRPLVVATADEQAFAGALQSLLTDADQRRRLGQANAERAKADYDLSIMEAAYRVLFDRA